MNLDNRNDEREGDEEDERETKWERKRSDVGEDKGYSVYVFHNRQPIHYSEAQKISICFSRGPHCQNLMIMDPLSACDVDLVPSSELDLLNMDNVGTRARLAYPQSEQRLFDPNGPRWLVGWSG